MPRISASARQESIANLREVLKPGDTVYCILRSVARSGMSRVLSCLTIKGDQVRQYDYHVSRILGETLTNAGVKVNGCGMDMGFHTVYSLSRALFPEGFGIPMMPGDGAEPADGKPYIPATKADAERMYAAGWRGVSGRNGDRSGWDADGGYALKHRWL